jgi:hypothetical protein
MGNSRLEVYRTMTKTASRTTLFGMIIVSGYACSLASGNALYFPSAGKSIENQQQANPKQVGLHPAVVQRINGSNPRLKSEGAATVGQWDRFEASVNNTKSYRDSYRDVSLNVIYESPDGRKTEFLGFYDGGTTWKIRFMPDQIGTWKYEAAFSDGSGGVSGLFRCAPSNIDGMMSADETNPMWFGFNGGKHILIRSFHVGDRFFAANWPASKRIAFLDWAQKQGYNMLSIASHYLNRPTKGRGQGWRTPDLWDSSGSRPRAKEYRKMEAILDELSRRRIMVYPFAGFCGQSSNFPTAQDDQEFLIRYTLARIGSYWNITFNVAGPDPQGRGTELLDRLGTFIKKNDIYAHPLSIHNYQRFDFPWVSYVVLQGWKKTDLQDIYQGMLEQHGNMPLYAQEVFWPGNYLHKKLVTNAQIRKKAYVLNMATAAINFADMGSGTTLGPEYEYANSSSGFSGSMDLKDRHQEWHDIVKKVWDFFETIPFYRMSPNQQIVDNGFCLAQEGRYYLVYLPDGGKVKLSLKAGRYKATWINAQDTSDRRSAGILDKGGEFSAPQAADDWLLFLTAEDASDAEPGK